MFTLVFFSSTDLSNRLVVDCLAYNGLLFVGLDEVERKAFRRILTLVLILAQIYRMCGV